MSVDKLKEIDKLWKAEDIEKILNESTIFDKIEFSGISKETIAAKIHDLEEFVPRRDVLLNMPDADVVEYWFKNWLHPILKHAVTRHGSEGPVTMRRNFLRFYENGQHNFDYTLQDVKDWIDGKVS